MIKSLFAVLSAVFLGIGGLIFVYLLLGNAGVIAGTVSIADAAQRWSLVPFLFLCFIIGMVFAFLSIMAAIASRSRRSLGYAGSGRASHQNRNGSYKYNSAGKGSCNSNFNDSSIDDMTRQQYQQFMDEMNRQQQQRFTDEMNREQGQQFMDEINRQQEQQFMDETNRQQEQQFIDEVNREQEQRFIDWGMDECTKTGTPFEDGGYNMDQGNSFNMDNFNNGF